MSDYLNQRYDGMGTYDLQRYYDLLLIMREYYRADKTKTSSFIFLLGAVGIGLIVALIGWSIWKNEWLALILSVGLATVWFSKALLKQGHEADFEGGFITKVMQEGFTRADATEFLYDLDWDDIQYEESRVEDILKDIKELNNAKNK